MYPVLVDILFVYAAIQFAAIVVSDADGVGSFIMVAGQPGDCVLQSREQLSAV